jgi:hypothetical protein
MSIVSTATLTASGFDWYARFNSSNAEFDCVGEETEALAMVACCCGMTMFDLLSSPASPININF